MELSEAGLSSLLPSFDWRLRVLEEATSTNQLLKQETAAPHGTVLLAKRQTRGRGRLGRLFSSPEGGIYLSVLLCPEGAPESVLHLTAMAAVAVRRAVQDFCGLQLGIKWVNDLVLEGKKLCGILTEAVPRRDGTGLILGIGINCNTDTRKLPLELQQTAGSLSQALGHFVEPNGLTACLLRRLYEMDRGLFSEKALWLREYEAACVTLGKQVRILGAKESYEAFALGIDENGGLIVRKEDGSLEHIFTGEVSVRGLSGYL